MAVRVTTEPTREIVWPIQSFTKSECPQRDGVTTDPRLMGRALIAGTTGAAGSVDRS
jgi:hypothetical protein